MADGPVRPGETVLVQGAGGVSLFALQFAHAAGATVIATTSSAERAAKLKALGAEHVLNYRESQNWGEEALALTGGFDIDTIPSPCSRPNACACRASPSAAAEIRSIWCALSKPTASAR